MKVMLDQVVIVVQIVMIWNIIIYSLLFNFYGQSSPSFYQ